MLGRRWAARNFFSFLGGLSLFFLDAAAPDLAANQADRWIWI